MTSPHIRVVTGAAAIFVCALALASVRGSHAQEPEGNYGIGNPEVFVPRYLAFRAQQLQTGNASKLRIRLGYVKGLSRSFTAMVGEMAIDLESGTYEVRLSGLTPGQTYSVWLIDRSEDENLVSDIVFRLTTILAVGPSALLTGVLGSNLPVGLTIDRVVVATGIASSNGALAAGSANVFQKLFFRRLTLLNDSDAILFDETLPLPNRVALVPDLAGETDGNTLPFPALPAPGSLAFASQFASAVAASASGQSVRLDKLISQGAALFFEKTFSGNGRTCGTCHPASNNFTIDPEFIETLPPTDPLFVAEFNPALAGLERPALMHTFGLILENLDGFSPTNKFVMRGVPHTLGLQATLQTDTSLPGPPAEMTGWSGDGAPGTGSLREFAIGAVIQHFTKNLARVEGRDFKLPTEHQLDAMEAFQRSLGRATDFTLATTNFTDAAVNEGKSLFINGTGDQNAQGTCAFCHANAGALSAALQNQNRNFNTNVEDVVHPAPRTEDFPHDGGFGRTANPEDGTFGNRTFNTASVVEAADTGPFFHNNLVSTLEGVVRFYGGPEFNNPRDATTRFKFTDTQVDQIADFMRAVNTLQNIDVARRELEQIIANSSNPQGEQNRRLKTAFDETGDAIDVLTEGGIFPAAVPRLVSAQNFIAQAQQSVDSNQRRSLVQQAITELAEARNAIAS